MGKGYIIGCNNCIKDEDLNNLWNSKNKINGTYFNIHIGGLMLCFCKEQLEKRYGVYKNYDRKYRLLAGGDPPEEIYKTLGSATNDKKIDKLILENIKNGYEFTENLGDFAYFCEKCNKLFNHFYFQMKKDEQIYTPDYKCKNCKHNMGLVNILFDDDVGLEFENEAIEEDIKIIYNYELFLDNNIVKIKNIDGSKNIICDYCKKDNFSILSFCMVD